MAAQRTGCPVHSGFDPLSDAFLRDPFDAMAGMEPVFYAPSLDYYVVTRYEDVERIFLDTETFSAANAQLPLIALSPEVGKTLLDGGHRPQPSMVSLDPPEHGGLRQPAATGPPAGPVGGQPHPQEQWVTAKAGRAGVHAAAGERDGAADPHDRRRA